MRTTLRLVLPLIVSVAVVSLLFATYQVRTQRKLLRSDLGRRAEILGESLQESVEQLLDKGSDKGLQRLVDRFGQREHLKGVALYDTAGQVIALTPSLDESFRARPAVAKRAADNDAGCRKFFSGQPVHIYALTVHRNDKPAGTLVVFHETTYIEEQVMRTLRDSLLNAAVQTVLIAGLALLLVRMTLTGPLTRTAAWLRNLRTGGTQRQGNLPQGPLFDQIHKEVTHLARDLKDARATAEEEARLRESNVSVWTAERLRVSLAGKLQNKPLFVVANREPYMHVYNDRDRSIQVLVPASGLVTALEPVVLACDGTWVAHGSGNADRDTVDSHDHLRVPPDHPTYTLRRVWLSEEEEKGYYEGFANEGLWPLCHIAHTRPIFRPQDWLHYQQANRRFADAVLEEMQGTKSPMFFVQE